MTEEVKPSANPNDKPQEPQLTVEQRIAQLEKSNAELQAIIKQAMENEQQQAPQQPQTNGLNLNPELLSLISQIIGKDEPSPQEMNPFTLMGMKFTEFAMKKSLKIFNDV